LNFESEEGKGSVFVLTLPVGFEGPAADAPVVSLSSDCVERLHGLSVLVVDDEPTNRRVLGAMLQQHAKHLELAANGVEALTLASKQAFDLVLMDIHMPRMNGFEAAEGLARMCADSGKPLPAIIYVSADTRDAMKVQSKEKHGAAFLVKPLQISSLCRCLTEVFQMPVGSGKS
jgi:CheY-like chemotaxis protein